MNGSSRHLGYVVKRFPRISETFVAAEIIELERQGERVTVFAMSRPDEPHTHAFLREMKATVVYLPHRPLDEPGRVARALVRVLRGDAWGWLRAAGVALWPPGLSGWRRLLVATVLRDEMRRAGIDHAHAHFATSAASIVNLSRRMGGPTYSVTAHAKDIYDQAVRIDRLRRRLTEAEFVATVSAANRDHLASLVAGRVPLHVIHNAVDLERLRRRGPHRPGGRMVLAVARLVEKKGLADLIAACAILAERGVSLRLEIAGDGPLRGELEEAAGRAAIPVIFHGSLPYEEVLELYRRAAVFCLPCVVATTGDRDGLPTSVLEAMALGVPVVTTAVNGLREVVVDGRTGRVVPERDPHALADALAISLSDAELAGQLAASARLLVERGFTVQRSVAALRALFPEAA